MSDPPQIAELGMYPFESVRWAWDELWAAVHAAAPWTPEHLAHSGDVHARWSDPSCVVNHVCGWPLVAHHRAEHRVVGAFAPTIAGAEGAAYRSTVVSRHDVPLADLVRPDARAVANSRDSLSGWVSFLNATVGSEGAWPGAIRFTGAHHESLRAVGRGDADLACIDSWSLAFIEREEPDLVAPLHRVGLGPLVPSPAVTVGRGVRDDEAEALAAAFEQALASPSLGHVRESLMIGGFVRRTIDDYLPTLVLATIGP